MEKRLHSIPFEECMDLDLDGFGYRGWDHFVCMYVPNAWNPSPFLDCIIITKKIQNSVLSQLQLKDNDFNINAFHPKL